MAQMKVKNLTEGFTLIELMVSIVMLAIVAVAATTLFFTAIRGGGKVGIATEVKQNGQFALAAMEQQLRSALNFTSCSATSVTVEAKDSLELTFSCEELDDGDPDTGYVASNGARLTSDKVVVTDCAFACREYLDQTQPPLISIDFGLRQTDSNRSAERSASARFSGSVLLRNYKE